MWCKYQPQGAPIWHEISSEGHKCDVEPAPVCTNVKNIKNSTLKTALEGTNVE